MSVPSPPQQPTAPPFAPGGEAVRPGSLAWVEQRYGHSASFGDRVLPGIIDSALAFVAGAIPFGLGIVSVVQGVPERSPGTGSGALVGLGLALMILSVVIGLAMVAWNRVWRVTRTGQSIGKKLTGLRLIDAETGALPALGPAALRELVHQFAGIISWIWMLVDHDDRTLADIVSRTHVVHVER